MTRFKMKRWNGMPVPHFHIEEWIQELETGPRGKPGQHAMVMSGDTMVLVVFGQTPADDECYDLEIRSMGRRGQ